MKRFPLAQCIAVGMFHTSQDLSRPTPKGVGGTRMIMAGRSTPPQPGAPWPAKDGKLLVATFEFFKLSTLEQERSKRSSVAACKAKLCSMQG